MFTNHRFSMTKGLVLPAFFLSLTVFANEVEEVHVYGHGSSLALPQKNISQDELERAQAGNLTKLLESMPGINNSSYGEGVGRPIIRGLSANRVKLAVNGSTNADVSAMSADHAPMMDMVNANDVEVIYGPNTLRFGSGAMGGMVNVKDGRFHDKAFSGVKARVQSSIGSNANARQIGASTDIGFGNDEQASIVHLDVYARETDNFTAGEQSGDSLEIESSSTEVAGGSVAYNFVETDKLALGVAAAYIDQEYFAPNNRLEELSITPEQTRIDFQADLFELTDSLERWESSLSFIDYEHNEVVANKSLALFDKEVIELQSSLFFHSKTDWLLTTGIQAQHEELAVCHDDNGGCDVIPDFSGVAWDGFLGGSVVVRDGYLFSHAAPMPLTDVLDVGLFAILGKVFGNLTAEFGVRYDKRSISTDPVSIAPSHRLASSAYDDIDFEPVSVSSGFTWDLGEQKVGLNVSHSERAPTSEEIYYNGDHHATFSYQLANLDLDVESAESIDITWQINLQNVLVDVAAFYYDFTDFIYNDLKSTANPIHAGDVVYRYEQADAVFQGGELSVDMPINADWAWFTTVDFVSAKFKGGNNSYVPRTPPATLRTGLVWAYNQWEVEADVHYYAKQTDVAVNESETDSYATLNAFAAYNIDMGDAELSLQLKASNLLNEFGRSHTSYLKAYSPIQGRNIELAAVLNF